MHIGFDVSQTGAGKAGCGYYADAMLQALLRIAPAHRFSLYPGFGDFYFDPRMPLRNPYPGANAAYGPRHLTRESAAAFWNAPGLADALGRPDIVHANNFWCPLQPGGSRLVYTLYDLAFLVDPSWTTEANRIGCFEGVFRSAIAADWIVAISEASRRDYLHFFPHFPAGRVRVIHPCSRFFAADDTPGERPAGLKHVVPGRFWLSVGTIEPRKNQRRLAEAFAGYLARGGEPMPLVLAGGQGWRMEDFPRFLDELGIARHVIVTGYVADAELIWLYRHCYANLYPSLFEGFGLPVLEGMQFGAPTIASHSSSIPEVAGEAAVLLPPEDTAAWTGAMLELAANPAQRDAMVPRSRARAACFDWNRSAGQLLALYDEALSQPARSRT
jgi:glycosyltransferase involved in cell wall biosynthesis